MHIISAWICHGISGRSIEFWITIKEQIPTRHTDHTVSTIGDPLLECAKMRENRKKWSDTGKKIKHISIFLCYFNIFNQNWICRNSLVPELFCSLDAPIYEKLEYPGWHNTEVKAMCVAAQSKNEIKYREFRMKHILLRHTLLRYPVWKRFQVKY